MKLDYDLSDLETSRADLWLSLRVDAICAQILVDQAKRRHSLSPGNCSPGFDTTKKTTQAVWTCGPYSLPGRSHLETLNESLSEQLSPWALPDPWSWTTLCVRAAFRWVH